MVCLRYHQGTDFSVTPLGRGNSGGQQLFLMDHLHLETFRRRKNLFWSWLDSDTERFGLIIAHNLMKINCKIGLIDDGVEGGQEDKGRTNETMEDRGLQLDRGGPGGHKQTQMEEHNYFIKSHKCFLITERR